MKIFKYSAKMESSYSAASTKNYQGFLPGNCSVNTHYNGILYSDKSPIQFFVLSIIECNSHGFVFYLVDRPDT